MTVKSQRPQTLVWRSFPAYFNCFFIFTLIFQTSYYRCVLYSLTFAWKGWKGPKSTSGPTQRRHNAAIMWTDLGLVRDKEFKGDFSRVVFSLVARGGFSYFNFFQSKRKSLFFIMLLRLWTEGGGVGSERNTQTNVFLYISWISTLD